MKQHIFQQQYHTIDSLLRKQRLSLALKHLIETCRECDAFERADKVETLITDYGYLLQYFTQGAEDPARKEMLNHLYNEAWNILDMLHVEISGREVLSSYYITWKKMRDADICAWCATCQTLLSPEKSAELETMSCQLFDAIRTNFPASRAEKTAINALILNDQIPEYYRAAWVSALMLNVLEYFDADKMEKLLGYTFDDMPAQIRIRAWVAILLIALKYPERIARLPHLAEQCRCVCEIAHDEDPDFLLRLQLQILQCLEAETAKRKLEEEITPHLEKTLRELKKKNQNQDSGQTILINEEEINLNPEWEEYLDNSGIRKKISDFMKLQVEGTDVMLNSFTSMRHLPFFRQACHWLTPFDPTHPSIAETYADNEDIRKFAQHIASSELLCNTDKHGNFFCFMQVSEAQRKALTDCFNRPDATIQPNNKSGDISRSYLHDLYRFFTLSPFQRAAYNPFAHNLLFTETSTLAPFVASYEDRLSMANYLFEKKRYEGATVLYRALAEEREDEHILQKLAYAAEHQSRADIRLTKNTLFRCNLLFPDKPWTLQYLARICQKEKEWETAAHLLQQVLTLSPDNMEAMIRYARCLLALNKTADALNIFYKADLIHEGNPRVTSGLAWCNFLLGNNEKAEQYITLTLSNNPTSNDWLNAGHIALQGNRVAVACERYNRCLEGKNPWDLNQLCQALTSDMENMRKAGIDEDLATLMAETFRRQNPR